MKDYYSLFGVQSNATLEEITSAYKKRLKVVHPDRFDQRKQPDEWQQANRMLQELNDAYAYLKKIHSNKNYEQSNTQNGTNNSSTQNCNGRDESSNSNANAEQPTQKQQAQHQHHSNKGIIQSPIEHLALNQVHFINHLIRTKGEAVKLRNNRIFLDYAGFIATSCFYFININDWSKLDVVVRDNYVLGCILLFILSALMAKFGLRIYGYHRAKVKPCVLFTPMYFIRICLDRIVIAYSWEVDSYRFVEEKYRSYFNVNVGGMVDKFYVPGNFSYAKFKENVDRMVDLRHNVEDPLQWVTVNDILRDLKPGIIKKITKLSTFFYVSLFVVTVMVCYALGNTFKVVSKGEQDAAQIEQYAGREAQQVNGDVVAPIEPSAPALVQQPPDFDKPTIPTPNTGKEYYYSGGKGLAPLQIIVPDAGDNYFIKIVGAVGNDPVRAVFVRSGGRVKIKVPLGEYKIKYAMGTTWYGRKYLFGPGTHFAKADSDFEFKRNGDYLSGHTIELIKQANGNLHSSDITIEEF